ncbi:sigma factor [Caproiciproducens faecalis]|uniref:RNA polymerase sigma factor SigI n=1 Tax=Caproiciproducens faecalis TaxID=2820301 RepID=A0ABS7DJU1_9FIRM|nr:sigma factor [Caproiciproducens faecalis]MBW7571364.1 RNA polymerase subunit sigma [Caproiciproducens faecalis]
MEDFDRKAVRAAKDAQSMDEFLLESEPFILKCAYSATHQYITKSDDEWSVAYFAFSESVKEYSIDKGSFPQFAKLVIRRRLIDYFRSQSKYHVEASVNPSVLDSELDEQENADGLNIEVKKAIYHSVQSGAENSLKIEIESVNQVFASYDFSFFDLSECSPKAQKTKKACAKAVVYIIRNPILLNEMRKNRMLPLKLIQNNTDIPRKILERHRKYIIAAAEIMTGDYPFLAEYMRFIREELHK